MVRKIFVIIFCFLLLVITSTIGYHVVSANQMVDEAENIILEQHNKEKYFSSFGFTIDNPNIIVNPYGISPLTALILFETDKAVSVTVTIEGKDGDTSYSHTFFSNKKHCIPIYGLYADYQNKIIISYEDITREFVIKTNALPDDFQYEKLNNGNNLQFISNDKYSYAIDKNNDVRWYLTKSYFGEFKRLQNGHFLLGNNASFTNQLFEIDFLGKIYYQYYIEDGYFGSFIETKSSLLVLSKNLLEIDKQSGTILNEIFLDQKYYGFSYNKESNVLEFYDKEGKILNEEVLDDSRIQKIDYNDNDLNSIFYFNNEEYKFIQGVHFSNHYKTLESKNKFFLVGYKKIDQQYLKYNIKIKKNIDYLQITGNFSNQDDVYVILDKFLDKKIYDLKNGNLIINHVGLDGRYSIYIKVNDTIYQTNYYVTFS